MERVAQQPPQEQAQRKRKQGKDKTGSALPDLWSGCYFFPFANIIILGPQPLLC